MQSEKEFPFCVLLCLYNGCLPLVEQSDEKRVFVDTGVLVLYMYSHMQISRDRPNEGLICVEPEMVGHKLSGRNVRIEIMRHPSLLVLGVWPCRYTSGVASEVTRIWCAAVHTHAHARTRTHTHAHTRTHTHSLTHSLTHIHSHTCTLTHVHAHTHSHPHALTHTHTHTHSHTLTHTHMHLHTHTHTHSLTHTLTHTHTHTHTHTQGKTRRRTPPVQTHSKLSRTLTAPTAPRPTRHLLHLLHPSPICTSESPQSQLPRSLNTMLPPHAQHTYAAQNFKRGPPFVPRCICITRSITQTIRTCAQPGPRGRV